MNVLRYDEGGNIMRQRKETIAAVIIIVCLLISLVIFGVLRGHPEHEEKAKHGIADVHRNSHDDTDTHEHGGHAEREYELSGELVEGIRIIKMKARRFEFDPGTIVVKAGEKVRLEVTSEDVVHGIGIKDFDINRKLKPGETETIIFATEKPGRHHFNSSVYCGSGHSDMHGELVVLSD